MSLMERRRALMMQSKSGKEIVLLASGTYTLAAQTSNMTIPVQYTGTVLFILIEAEEFIQDTYQTAVWQGTFNFPRSAGSNALSSYGVARARSAANAWISPVSSGPTLTETSLKVGHASSSYPIRANTYKWEFGGTKNRREARR